MVRKKLVPLTLLLWIAPSALAGWEYTTLPSKGRVQVMGTREPDPAVAEYAEMLKEDAKEDGSVGERTESEFEAYRSRLRTRSVAEAPKKAKPKVADIPPPPPMETEVITPPKTVR
jgi:hypothetical protein